MVCMHTIHVQYCSCPYIIQLVHIGWVRLHGKSNWSVFIIEQKKNTKKGWCSNTVGVQLLATGSGRDTDKTNN